MMMNKHQHNYVARDINALRHLLLTFKRGQAFHVLYSIIKLEILDKIKKSNDFDLLRYYDLR